MRDCVGPAVVCVWELAEQRDGESADHILYWLIVFYFLILLTILLHWLFQDQDHLWPNVNSCPAYLYSSKRSLMHTGEVHWVKLFAINLLYKSWLPSQLSKNKKDFCCFFCPVKFITKLFSFAAQISMIFAAVTLLCSWKQNWNQLLLSLNHLPSSFPLLYYVLYRWVLSIMISFNS